MGNLLVRSWCKVGNAGSCVSIFVIFPLLSHALTGVVFLLVSRLIRPRLLITRRVVTAVSN